MKTFKKVCVFLLMFMLCINTANTVSFAQISTQDGLEVNLTTDKQEYEKGDKIKVNLEVTNTNNEDVKDVCLENIIPDGYKLADDTEGAKEISSLKAGEVVKLITVFEVSDGNTSDDDNGGGTSGNKDDNGGSESKNPNDNSNVKTGDNNNIIFWSIAFLGSVLILVVIFARKKISKKLFFFGICTVMAGSIAFGKVANVYADEKEYVDKTIDISEKIIVDGKEIELKSAVNYKWESDKSSDDSDIPDLDFSLGEDVVPNLDFEPKEANPSHESIEDEIEAMAKINDGTTPYMDYDDNGVPNFIDGKFSDKTVNSAEDAIDALNDIHHIMKFKNVYQEFIEKSSDSVNIGQTTNYYRLQQVYHNIPVYGHQLIVSTNSSGNIQTLSGHYYEGLNLEINPTLTMEEAKDIARKDSGNDTEAVSDGLYIYTINQESPILVWKIRTFSASYFINAMTGDIVTTESGEINSTITGSGINMYNKSVHFPVFMENNNYTLYDDRRNIFMLDANHTDETGSIISKNINNEWSSNKEAITAYTNMIKVYDYYLNILGRDGANNAHREIGIRVNYREIENREYFNAFFNHNIPGVTCITLGDGNNYAKPLDVIAHEFTHAVGENIWDYVYLNESGALSESYSDIIGDLIEDNALYEHGEDLLNGANRRFDKPEQKGQPSHLSNHVAYCYENHNHENCDCGGVHYNSGIVNHAAYLMDQNWPVNNHADELARLFYKSMYNLSSNSTFMDCRHAVLSAAKSMNMSDEKRAVIAKAFENVGIVNEDKDDVLGLHHITGKIKEAGSEKNIIDAKIVASRDNIGVSGGTAYTNGSGEFDLKVRRGIYTLTISAEGYRTRTISSVDLSSLLDLSNDIGTIYLTPKSNVDGKIGRISGKVCKASDRNEPVSNANISIYRDGTQYYTATTDNSGNYSILLSEGDYYIVISAAGYVDFTSYATVTANNNTYMETFLMVNGSVSQTGIAKGSVYNALTGNGVEDVKLEIRKGWNAIDTGDVVKNIKSGQDGTYSVMLPFGNYTVFAYKDGYISTTFNIIVKEGTTDSQNGTISPVIYGDGFRIVLSWGENPSDLDSHVVGTLLNGDSFHIYYNHKSQTDGDLEVCNLDVDDITSYGPETITLNCNTDNPYYYYIHRYSGSGSIASSGAKIKVYQGESLIATFNAPTDQGNGDYWNVFSIVDGKIVTSNTITSEPNLNYVRGNNNRSLSAISDEIKSESVEDK